MNHQIKTIGIIGAGRMGTGIAQTGLVHQFEILIFDALPDQLQKGIKAIQKGLDLSVSKGSLSPKGKKEAETRLHPVSSLDQIKSAGFVIEAAVENETIKTKIFKELDAFLPPAVVMASNTSSISITRLGSATQNPGRVIGMHFMNPVPVMELVEIIPGFHTSPGTKTATLNLAKDLGKTAVESADTPGFIVNRILMPMINEAAFALMEQTGTAEAIDRAMTLGAHFPMGPLELADMIGLDICLDICEVMHREFGEPKYIPCPLLKKYVEAGWLGKKTGRGFYTYPDK
jgi:3-hydroxybutyryl-CoA dehydrogenase